MIDAPALASNTLAMEDRQKPEALLTALNASPRQLRRDDCGDWRIKGQRGHIYVDGDGYLLVVHAGSARRWTSTKQRLPFCRVTQDGDDEGCLHLDRLPTKDGAAAIRIALRIRRRRKVSPETRARLKKLSTERGDNRPPVR